MKLSEHIKEIMDELPESTKVVNFEVRVVRKKVKNEERYEVVPGDYYGGTSFFIRFQVKR